MTEMHVVHVQTTPFNISLPTKKLFNSKLPELT